MCEFDKLDETFASDLYVIYKRSPSALVSFAVVLMTRTPPQQTSAEPSETFHSTKLTNDIEASRFKKPAL